jgi:hypothetical protein
VIDPEVLRQVQRLQRDAAAQFAALNRVLPRDAQLAAVTRAAQLAAVTRPLLAQQLAGVARTGQIVFRILEDARRGQVAAQEILDQLAPRGWLISPSAPAEIAEDLLIELKRHGLARVEKLLMEELPADVCGEMLDSLYDRSSFAEWKGTFGKALQAHTRGDFELSIPIWLLAIDGISSQELMISKIYSKVQGKKGTRRLLDQLSWQTITGSTDPLLLAVVQVLAGFGKPSRRTGTPAVLNRNAVLHGQAPTIGTEKDSIQCILVLEVLHFCLEMRDQAKARRRRP